jgi:phosphatidylglycerophosphate synthase
MLDGVDGELARLKFSGSKFGEWFDTLTDDIGKFLFFIGSGVGAAAVLGSSIWFNLLALSVAMQVAMSYFIYRKLIQSGSGSHYALAWDGPPQDKPLWTRLITRIEFLSRRDAYVAIWLLLTAIGLVQVGIVLSLASTSCVLISELVSPRRARVGFVSRGNRDELPRSASHSELPVRAPERLAA